MTVTAGDDTRAVDQLARTGRIDEAAQQLQALIANGGGDASSWLKLAALQRALNRPQKALESVHEALIRSPLDFVALTMRAGLMERLKDAGAGEAWGEAIAQKPTSLLPPPLEAAIAAGERFHARWLDEREEKLLVSAASALEAADEDQAWRIDRFRSNILRRTRVYRSEPTHFAYPGLTEREFHPLSHFPWLADLEAKTEAIRQEALALLRSERGIEPYIQYEDREALAQWRPLNHNPGWSALHLLRQGQVVAENANLAPQTMAALQALGQRQVPGASPNAMFSLLAPNTRIPAHVGVDNTRLVCHLPLVVPPGCWFRVGAETRFWREGEGLVFDDTIEHEALNPSDDLRIVLIFDVWHPGLSKIEQEAISSMIAIEGGIPVI